MGQSGVQPKWLREGASHMIHIAARRRSASRVIGRVWFALILALTSAIVIAPAAYANVNPILDSFSCPTNPWVNQPFTCTFSGHDPDSTGVYYFVDWGDGSDYGQVPPAGTGTVPNYQQQSLSHTPTYGGVYTIRVLVLDTLGGNSGWSSKTVTVNIPPYVGSFNCDRLFEVNHQAGCSFYGYDTDSDSVYYFLDWGDGSAIEHIPATGTVPNYQPQRREHTFTVARSYNVKLLVLDTVGGNSGWTTAVVVVDVPPVLDSSSCVPTSILVGQSVTCTFKGHDPDSTAGIYYYVDWGDGSGLERVPSTGLLPNNQQQSRSRTFSTSGAYQVKVGVVDAVDGWSGWSTPVTIGVNAPPVVDSLSCSPASILVNQQVTCTFTGHDQDTGALYYQVDWGDGSAVVNVPVTGTVPNNQQQSRSHAYPNSGTYAARVRAVDPIGTSSAWSSVTIGVNSPPVLDSASCAPASILVGQQVTCTFSGHDTDTGSLYYYVDWGDGSTIENVPTTGTVPNNQQQSRNHTFGASGTFTVRILALDTLGGNSGSWRTFTVGVNAPPILDTFSCDVAVVGPGQPVACTFAGHDPDTSGLYYFVDWGEGGPVEHVPTTGTVPNGQQQVRSHSFATNGTYAIRVLALDLVGGSSGWRTVNMIVNLSPVLDALSCGLDMAGTDRAVGCTFRGHDPDSSGLYYYVDWGDGSTIENVPTTGTVPNNQPQSRSHTYASGGGSYNIRVIALDSYGFGSGWQTWSQPVGTCAGPTADCAPSAIDLGEEGSATATTAGATADPGEPFACGAGTRTIWFRYVVPAPGTDHRVVFDTGGSGHDTVATVYTGQQLEALTRVACNDNWAGAPTSRIEWLATPGTTYYIQVAGAGVASGAVTAHLRTARLMVFGDSVAAGYGNSTTAVFGYPNSPDAYGYKLGNMLKMPAAVVAIAGSCAGTPSNGDPRTDPTSNGDPGTDPDCTKSILGDQLMQSPWTPTDIVITVGANDIDFGGCIKEYLARKNELDSDVCTTQMAYNIAVLQVNLKAVVMRLKMWGPVSPRIVLTKYFNPFPPALQNGESIDHVCDMWFPAVMSRYEKMTLFDPSGGRFRGVAAAQQVRANDYTVEVLRQLNEVGIQAVADDDDDDEVNAVQLDFAGHDICASVRGVPGPSWIYGPNWNDELVMRIEDVPVYSRSYDSRPMGPECTANPDDPNHVDVHTVTENGEHWLHFRNWCLPHPTKEGQQAIADLVAPMIPTG